MKTGIIGMKKSYYPATECREICRLPAGQDAHAGGNTMENHGRDRISSYIHSRFVCEE